MFNLDVLHCLMDLDTFSCTNEFFGLLQDERKTLRYLKNNYNKLNCQKIRFVGMTINGLSASTKRQIETPNDLT